MELCHQFRPKKLKDVVGQPDAVRMLSKFVAAKKIPRAMIFAGPSGTGKTTMARIVGRHLTKFGLCELNCASIEPLKVIRAIVEEAGFKTLTGEARVWILDEFQSLSRAPRAQEACLKLIEDSEHAYFFLCTTEPTKIILTIRNRCTEIACKPVNDKEMGKLLERIIAKIGNVNSDVQEKIIEVAEGSPRKALVLLDSLYMLDTPEQQLRAIETSSHEKEMVDLAKCICKPNARWTDAALVLKGLEGQEVEGIRRIVLKYCKTIILNAAKNPVMSRRAHEVIEAFADARYDGGFPALCSATFAICK